MSEFKSIMNFCVPIIGIVLVWVSASAVYDIVPERHVAIWTQFQRVKTDRTSEPGFYFKSPLTKAIHVFTGIDKDEVPYTCGTLDGITFKGVVALFRYHRAFIATYPRNMSRGRIFVVSSDKITRATDLSI